MAVAATWSEWLERLIREGKLPDAGETLEAMAATLRKSADALEGPPPRIAEARGLTIPGPAGPLGARLYTPLAAGLPPEGGLVFFHGGGFVIGDLDSHDRLCRRIAAASHVRVLSVAYRLAPADRFPAAVEDALAAFDWAAGAGAESLGFDPERVAVGGDSAGGNLAAVVAQARRRGGGARAPACQLLLYPLLQLVETNARRPKVLEGHLMSAAILEGVRERYLGADVDPRDPRASPLFTQDLGGICPAFVLTAGLDPLKDEGTAYADMLAAAGVPVLRAHYASAPHGFLQMGAVLDAAHEAAAETARALAHAVAGRDF